MKYYFRGLAKWAKVYDTPKDETFVTKKGKKVTKKAAWSLDLYMDEKSMAAYKNSGIQRTVRTDADGEDYVQFERTLVYKDKEGVERNRLPPNILDSENNEFHSKERIGNGTEVTISVDVYESANGKGSRLESIRVENFIPYKKGEISEDTLIDMPF